VWLQQDGAPAHFAVSVRDVLNEHFPGRWIGHGNGAGDVGEPLEMLYMTRPLFLN
jgi:hypothetical protein